MQELLKMFNDSDSFFYSPTGDLTNTLQRQFSGKYDQTEPLWKRVRILKTVKIMYKVVRYQTRTFLKKVHFLGLLLSLLCFPNDIEPSAMPSILTVSLIVSVTRGSSGMSSWCKNC